ncbi:MAG: PHP domain-containing protein [Chloroflexi bacterium]|nr:PHP domain-containing protein [Chloroflexota bacterium]
MKGLDHPEALKLDLHTHLLEALRLRMPTLEAVGRIVARVEAAGLDGIAITEHDDAQGAFRVKEMVDEHFDGRILVIPGQEIDVPPEQIVELYLPGGITFRFLAHPCHMNRPPPVDDSLHGIEIANWLHDWHINQDVVVEVAAKHNLIILRNSDAHHLEQVGRYHNLVSLEELAARAQKTAIK